MSKQHPDDLAVDKFAAAMKAKLAKKRKQGRSGWERCSDDYLARLLIEHVEKGDPVDIGNFSMMLWCNSETSTTHLGCRQELRRALREVAADILEMAP